MIKFGMYSFSIEYEGYYLERKGNFVEVRNQDDEVIKLHDTWTSAIAWIDYQKEQDTNQVKH